MMNWFYFPAQGHCSGLCQSGLALVGGCDRSYLIWAGSYRLGWFRQTASGSYWSGLLNLKGWWLYLGYLSDEE